VRTAFRPHSTATSTAASHLHQRLHLLRRRQAVVDHAAVLVGSLYKRRILIRGQVSPAYDGIASSQIFPSVESEHEMADLGAVVAQLKAERAKLDKAIEALSGVGVNSGGGRRRLSAAARERIAAAQRARWAKFKAKKAK
jgi:hypothetical protein